MFILPKSRRIINSNEFRKTLFKRDKVLRYENFNCYFKKNDKDFNRMGVSVSKNVGKACVRNRYKRYTREFFRLNQYKFPQGYDFIFIIKKYKRPIDHSYFNNQSRFQEIVKYFEE